MRMSNPSMNCYCGKNQVYAHCCARYIEAGELPQTPEQLMRSRYTAYVLENKDYLHQTWDERTRPSEHVLKSDNQDLHFKTQWLGLEIKRTWLDSERKDTGYVEFVARYKVNGKAYKMHERSRFIQHTEEGSRAKWFYVDGVFPSE